MAPFRPESILIINPKSKHTLVQFGLNDETFMIPDYKIPTCIFKDQSTGNYYSTLDNQNVNEASIETIYPIENGEIKDLDSFLQYLKLLYSSILAQKSNENPNAFDLELSNIPLLLVTHHSWSQYQLETISQFIFEHLKVNSLMFLPTALATSYAMISLQNCCIIDIGTNHTDVVPIVDFTPMNHLASTLPMGGNSINEYLKEHSLPQLELDQLESLKKSNIFEVLSDEAMERKIQNGIDDIKFGEEDEDVINVADLVTSGRDTRELLEERERNKNEKNISNSELDYNDFWDMNGNNIKVGRQRFQGCNDLITRISKRVGLVLSQVDDINKLKLIWENLVIVGGPSSIQGFKENLLAQLMNDHLVIEPEEERLKREQILMESTNGGNKKKNHKAFQNAIANPVHIVDYLQTPTTIRLAKYAEYFPEWKKYGYAEIQFLGGQIVAKQVFTHSRDIFYITRESYDKFGPSCIWDVDF